MLLFIKSPLRASRVKDFTPSRPSEDIHPPTRPGFASPLRLRQVSRPSVGLVTKPTLSIPLGDGSAINPSLGTTKLNFRTVPALVVMPQDK